MDLEITKNNTDFKIWYKLILDLYKNAYYAVPSYSDSDVVKITLVLPNNDDVKRFQEDMSVLNVLFNLYDLEFCPSMAFSLVKDIINHHD